MPLIILDQSERYTSYQQRYSNVINTFQNARYSRNNRVTLKSEKRIEWYTTHCRKLTFSALFTSLAMTVGILTVCLTIPKPNKLCQSSFQALINADSLQRNSNPCSIATGDFNHDTFLDLVVANPGTGTIGIFLNDGNGTFASQIIFPTGDSSRPLSVVVGDFNSDTHLDVAVANYYTHNIGIFLGDGNGTFANQITFSTGASRPVSLAVGDLNNDHWLDIVTTNNRTDNISILFGYGNGSFANQITFTTGYDSFPCSILLVDMNNDHHLDISVVNYGTDNVGIFLGYGNGSFTTQTVFSTNPWSRPSSIAAHDFNRDGHLDIVVAHSATNNIGIFLGYGNGSFQRQVKYFNTFGSNAHSIVIADFNQDKHADIAVSNYGTNNISILIGYGNGSFAIPTVHSTGRNSGPLGMIAGDLDNDNQSDIAVVNSATNNVFVLLGYAMLQSQNPPSYSTGVNSVPDQIASGDFNNDTAIDLVIVNAATKDVSVFFAYGNGSFREQITYSTGNTSYPTAVALADLDNDRRLDIVVAHGNNHAVGVLYGFTNATFTEIVAYSTGNSTPSRSIIVIDLNNDNHLDIAFADYTTNSIGILFGYGNRSFSNVMTYSPGFSTRPLSIAAGDFNKDGRIDIATTCYGTGTVAIYFGSDNNSFTLFTSYATGDGSLPFMLTVADLNRDSYLDLIVANYGTNNVGILFGLGNGSFTAQTSYSTGSNSLPIWVSVADLNNDHALDLAVVNQNLNNVGVFLGNNDGSFGDQTTYPTGPNSNPYSIVIGDFNKDNRLDVAVANTAVSNVAILLGHPTADSSITNRTTSDVPILLGEYYPDFRSQVPYSTGSSSGPYSIAVGDLNNDKQMDLIVANSGDATLGIFLGHGNGTFLSEVIYPLDIGSDPQNVIVSDFNRDNLLDVAVTNPRNDSIIVLLGNGDGTFPIKMTYSTGYGSQPSALVVGNFNNDNYADLVVANKGTDTIGIFFGFDYTHFTEQILGDTGENSSPTSIVIADFNNDGYLDAATALYGTNNGGVFLNYGNGTFRSMMTFADVPASHSWSFAVGDFNDDKQLDIAVANWGVDSISIILGFGNGSFTSPILYSTGSNTRPISVTVGDFDNDHCLDIITANYGANSIALFLGYGNGTFQQAITLSTGQGSGVNSVIAADINNDTHLDIISTNQGTNDVGIFLGYGNGSFAAQVTFSTGSGSAPWCTVAGDFNKDGRIDLAIANWGATNVGVLYGYGNGTFGNLQMLSTGAGSQPIDVDVGDFNNDGQLDIIVTDNVNTCIGMFFNYGDGTFTSMSTIPTAPGSSSTAVAVGDLNNDTRLDFFVAYYSNNNIEVFLASGSRHFGGQTTFNIGENSRPSSVVVGYFNNDHLMDIAITNSATDNIGILLGYGNRLFSNITTYFTGADSHPISLAVGDFNNDSLADMVVANSDANTIVVFIGHGHSHGNFSSWITYSMGEGSQPVSIAVGHFNRDNQLDIAIANFGTNNVCVLFGCGNGSFTNQTWYPLDYDSRPNWIVSKDLNNDGQDDLAVVIYGADNVKILLNIC